MTPATWLGPARVATFTSRTERKVSSTHEPMIGRTTPSGTYTRLSVKRPLVVQPSKSFISMTSAVRRFAEPNNCLACFHRKIEAGGATKGRHVGSETPLHRSDQTLNSKIFSSPCGVAAERDRTWIARTFNWRSHRWRCTARWSARKSWRLTAVNPTGSMPKVSSGPPAGQKSVAADAKQNVQQSLAQASGTEERGAKR